MDLIEEEDAQKALRALDAMTLFATLKTATEVERRRRERAAGHNPSEQEPLDFVLAYLEEARMHLAEGYGLLRSSAVLSKVWAEEREATEADESFTQEHMIQHFQELVWVQEMAQTLQTVHQRLMSLFPHVSAWRVEQTRLLAKMAETLPSLSPHAYPAARNAFLDRMEGWLPELD